MHLGSDGSYCGLKRFRKLWRNAVAQEEGMARDFVYNHSTERKELIRHYILQDNLGTMVEVTYDKPIAPHSKKLKLLFREQIIQFRKNVSMQRLLRKELVTSSTFSDLLFERQETNCRSIIDAQCTLQHASRTAEATSLSPFFATFISYLALLFERLPNRTTSTCIHLTSGKSLKKEN